MTPYYNGFILSAATSESLGRESARLLEAPNKATGVVVWLVETPIASLRIPYQGPHCLRLGLTLGDYDRRESTLHIRETKFYKSRLLPINSGIAEEIDRCLRTRAQRKLPVSANAALIWNASGGGRAY